MTDQVPDTTLAWLAALIDGEGSILFTKGSYSEAAMAKSPSLAKRSRLRASVAVSNTDYRLMEALKERTGIGAIYTHVRQPKENQKKTAYTWRMNATELRVWLPRIAPWLVLKQEQATLLLEALDLKESMTVKAGEKWTIDWNEVKLRQDRLVEIAEEISALNRKGRR